MIIRKIHKYYRRLIVWLNSPSDEEINTRILTRNYAEQQVNCMRVLRCLRNGGIPLSWSGYTRDQAEQLIDLALVLAPKNDIPGARVDQFIQNLGSTLQLKNLRGNTCG